jgi:hypothetical protein
VQECSGEMNQMPSPKGNNPSVCLTISVNGTDHARWARFAGARHLLEMACRATRAIMERHCNELQGDFHMSRRRCPQGRSS